MCSSSHPLYPTCGQILSLFSSKSAPESSPFSHPDSIAYPLLQPKQPSRHPSHVRPHIPPVSSNSLQPKPRATQQPSRSSSHLPGLSFHSPLMFPQPPAKSPVARLPLHTELVCRFSLEVSFSDPQAWFPHMTGHLVSSLPTAQPPSLPPSATLSLALLPPRHCRTKQHTFIYVVYVFPG